MKVVRHGKPSNQYLETLRKPRKDDYKRLVQVALEAIVQGEKDVLIAFAYVLKFPDDFPRGILIEKLDDKNIHRIKARKLLKWLNENGHTDITAEMLAGQQRMMGRLLASFDENIDLGIDEDQQIGHNDV